MILRTTLLAGMCYLAFLLPAQTTKFSPLSRVIDSFMVLKRVNDTTPGGAVAIIHRGEVVFKKGYGLANLEHRIPFTPATISDIGSVAKQMTVLGVLELVRLGRLKLDDPLSKFITCPPHAKNITIRQLMQHTSGLKEVYDILPLTGWKQGDRITQQDARSILHHIKDLNFPSGSQFSYCNTGYMLLAELIEQVTGVLFETYMRKALFMPLGMDQTYIMDRQGEVFPNCATSYQNYNSHPSPYAPMVVPQYKSFTMVYDNSEVIGAGGVYMSLDDLILWAKHLHRPKELWLPWVDTMKTSGKLTDGKPIGFYGLGLDLHPQAPAYFGHTGSSAGYRANLFIYPDLELILITKTNRPDLTFDPLLKAILAHFGYKEQASEPEEEPQFEDAVDLDLGMEQVGQMVGDYTNEDLQLTYKITQNGGELFLVHPRLGLCHLSLESPTDFLVVERSDLHDGQFIKNDQGRILGLMLNWMFFKKLN